MANYLLCQFYTAPYICSDNWEGEGGICRIIVNDDRNLLFYINAMLKPWCILPVVTLDLREIYNTVSPIFLYKMYRNFTTIMHCAFLFLSNAQWGKDWIKLLDFWFTIYIPNMTASFGCVYPPGYGGLIHFQYGFETGTWHFYNRQKYIWMYICQSV